MNKLMAAFCLCLFAILPTAPVLAHDVTIRQALQARYADMKAAMGARYAKAISALLAPNFVTVDTSGQAENADEMIAELKMLPVDPLKVSQTTLLAVRLTRNVAVVDQRYDMKTVKTAADGTKSKVELVTLSTDTWVSTNGTWLCERTVTNKLDYFANGQLVLHKERAR